MHPKFLTPVLTPWSGPASSVLAVPVGGAGAFPLGIAKTFAQQFQGNKRTALVVSLMELLYAAASETRLNVFFVAVPEWSLFVEGKYALDIPDASVNFMLYYLMVIVFPTEDSEIVFKGVVGRLLSENLALTSQKAVSDVETEENELRKGPPGKRIFIETPRVRLCKGSLPHDVTSQLVFTDTTVLKEAIKATGVGMIDQLPADATLPDEVWTILSSHLCIDRVLTFLQPISGLKYPPWIRTLRLGGMQEFIIPEEIIKYKLVSTIPHVQGRDQLALFMLPGIISPARIAISDDFDVPMIGGDDGESLYVSSETRGVNFKDPSKLLSPLPAICSKMFRRLLRNAENPVAWSHVYRYCHKYMRMLFANPFVAGFPSIYRDLFSEIDRLRDRAKSDSLMNQFYKAQEFPENMSIVHHHVSLVIALLHSAGLRDNHVVVALAYLSASGSCRIFGGDSDITAFTGTAGKGKSNILNMISALVNDVSQYSMDASSARAITMPQNPIMVAGRLVGEAPQNGRITFTDDGGGAFQPGKGSHADKDGDAMKLTQASRGNVTYQVVNAVEDAQGNKSMKVQTRVVACKSSRFMAMNGNGGSDAGASRMQCFFVKSSVVAPGQSASAVCALDVNGVPDELESMFCANQLRNAEVSYYNALIAFGLANDASLALWQIFIIRALESPSAKEFVQELKILQSPRKVGSIVRNSLSLCNNKLFHLLETGGFADKFIGADTLKKCLFLQQANYASSEILALALSTALPVCNGASNIERDILRNIKDLIDFDVSAPYNPRTCRKSGQTWYILKCPTLPLLQQSIRDHMPEYEPVDVANKLADICKATVPKTTMQFLEKDGDRLIVHSGPLDRLFCTVELNVLAIMNTQLEELRTAYPLLHDVFPHDQTDTLLLIPNDLSYIFSRHANNPQIDDLGSEFEMGMALLHSNMVYGPAISVNTNRAVHARDIPKPASLPLHFPGTPVMHNCLAINLRALDAKNSDVSTGILGLIPCFESQTCMIATGKPNLPEVPETVSLKGLTESFIITNPHHISAHMRGFLPSNETSVVEKEFFGTDFEKIEIPPGPITELYLVYMRSFILWRMLPLRIARPDFISYYLKHGSIEGYRPYLPVRPYPSVLAPGVGTIYELFRLLALKMNAVGLVDDVIEALVPRVGAKRPFEDEDSE